MINVTPFKVLRNNEAKMPGIWKKILFCSAILIFLFVITGCERDRGKTKPEVSKTSRYTLAYTAGDNGSIDGPNPQTVIKGGTGSMVKAVPAAGYHFVKWSDGGTTATRADRNITADLELTAEFAVDQYTLTYLAGKHGSIEGSNPQTIAYGGSGNSVTAVPETGFHFVKWSDGVTTANRTDANVKAEITATAEFAINQYTLIYSAGENGSIDGTKQQTVTHGNDASPVRAVPAEHYHFAGWSDGISTAARTDHNVTENHRKLTANFSIDQYTLSYLSGEHGSISGITSQKVDHGTTGSKVEAVAAKGYHFVKWNDGVTTASRTDSDVTADITATAEFTINRYTLVYSAGENGSIDGANRQTVDYGGSASAVTAVAARGYHFRSWSDGITTPQRIDSGITGDLEVKAFFEVNTYTVGGLVSGLVEGTQVVLQNNGADDLTITANADFRFATELREAETYEVSVAIQPSSPNQICTVTRGSGTISEENILDIEVTCTPVTYQIGGTVSGLPPGDQVILQNNSADELSISTNGAFTFAKPLDDGSQYKVKIFRQPQKPHWTCIVENGAGTLAGTDVSDVVIDCYPEVLLQATAGIRNVKLNWNSGDFDEVFFNLCMAQEELPEEGFNNCRDFNKAKIKRKLNSPFTVTELKNDVTYWFQMQARYKKGRKTLSKVVKAIPFGGLNDTGIDWCADNTANRNMTGTRGEKRQGCEAMSATYPNQDAYYGRDPAALFYKLPKVGSGWSGFDFTKVCINGDTAGEGDCPPNPILGSSANNWGCTRDNVTGLLWEVKTVTGMRSGANSYTWFNPDETKNGGAAGQQNGGVCTGSDCDTQAYVQKINALRLCGTDDWRLPTRMELLSILNNSYNPAINSTYFPNTLVDYYWSSSPYSEDENAAWQVSFKYGEAYSVKKNEHKYVRLVHGRTVTFGFDNP